MVKKFVIEGTLVKDAIEDSGRALISTWEDNNELNHISDPQMNQDEEPGIGVSFSSWCEKLPIDHSRLEQFFGKRVRVTMEVI